MNRRLAMVFGLMAGAIMLLIAIGLLTEKDDESNVGLRALGVAAGTVCSLPRDVPAHGASTHVSGTVAYDRVPPSSGEHATTWVNVLERRYEPSDAPPVEQVVHNLEHGWIVIWYSPAATDLALLDRALAEVDQRKVVAMPYERGALPASYVLTAWGHEQRCSAVSGADLATFVDDHVGNNGDAPEPEAP